MGQLPHFSHPLAFATEKKNCLRGQRRKESVTLDVDLRLETVKIVMVNRTMTMMIFPSTIFSSYVPSYSLV